MRFRWFLVLIMVATLLAGPFTQGDIAEMSAQDEQATPSSGPASEVVVDGQRHLFDRDVPIDPSQLEETSDDAGDVIYTKPEGGPLGAVYVQGDDGNIDRYLPEHLDAPETACPDDATGEGPIQGAGASYIPANVEPDITTDVLTEVGSTDDGRTIFATSTDQPFGELFVTGSNGDALIRYVQVAENGMPSTFSQQLTFAGQQFQLVTDADVNVEDLQKVGCAVTFPALASSDEMEPPFSAVHVQVGDQLITYRAVDVPGQASPTAAQATQPVIEPAEPLPTGTPSTPAPTQPLATEPPADTPEPTFAPTVTPTQAAEPTVVPTGVPTETPGSTAAATQAPTTDVPTESPATQAPTETLAATATVQAPDPPSTETPSPTQTPASRPTPTPEVSQPQAVVPTYPPNAPPPAAATMVDVACSGNAGDLGADGLPVRLPSSLQYGGTGYRFVETVPAAEVGELTRLGCVGPFQVLQSDSGDAVLYLTVSPAAETTYRYEATSSFSVSFEVTNDPRILTLQGTGDQPDVTYVAGEPLVRSVYSSVSLVLFVPDAAATQPDRVLGYAVDGDVIGEYVPEGSAEPAPEEVRAEAEELGIHPTLTLGTGEQTYVLVSLWRPFGTTTNGWVTLYGPQGEATPEQLAGIDPRRPDMPIFTRQS